MSLIKNLARKLVPELVWAEMANAKIEYRLSKVTHHIDTDLKDELDKLIDHLPFFFSKYYFDVGAHDGRTYSNTYHLDHSYKWSGILVEPILHLSFKSRRLRSLERNQFVTAACVGPGYQGESIKLLYCDLMTLAPEISENIGNAWVSGGEKFLPTNQVITEVFSPARTANQILQDCNAPQHIGLFSIDVEGAELEVLQGLDFNKYKFGIVLVETAVDSTTNQYLEDMGYYFYKHIEQNRIFLNNCIKLNL
jgi:FkbM family methyltransferase